MYLLSDCGPQSPVWGEELEGVLRSGIGMAVVLSRTCKVSNMCNVQKTNCDIDTNSHLLPSLATTASSIMGW